MRTLSPVRKKLAAIMAAAFVATMAFTATASPVAAAPGRDKHPSGMASKATSGASLGPEDSAKSQLPAPPRPPQKVPTERVVKTGQLGKRAKGTMTSQIRDAFSTVLGAATTSTTASTGLPAPGAATS